MLKAGIIYMSNLDEKLKKLNSIPHLSNVSKQKIKSDILAQNNKSRKIIPTTITAIVTLFIIGFTYILSNENFPVQNSPLEQSITDPHTPETLPKIALTDNSFTIEWLHDSMDRGNHDLNTNVHGNLVVSNEIENLNRGDIIYYEMDKNLIGRIIGLPGESVEIREGKIYINNKKLDTFYGFATVRGLAKEEYFEKVSPENRNGYSMLDHYNTTTEPVYVNEGTLFILVDHWWRGTDSRNYGPIPLEKVKGKIIGYEE